jgi:hypothetical protein
MTADERTTLDRSNDDAEWLNEYLRFHDHLLRFEDIRGFAAADDTPPRRSPARRGARPDSSGRNTTGA